MNMDLSIDLQGEEPKVLIYHTHSQEAFADSRPGEWQDTVVGLGETLKNNLEHVMVFQCCICRIPLCGLTG